LTDEGSEAWTSCRQTDRQLETVGHVYIACSRTASCWSNSGRIEWFTATWSSQFLNTVCYFIPFVGLDLSQIKTCNCQPGDNDVRFRVLAATSMKMTTSGMLRRVVSYIFTYVSGVLAASIISSMLVLIIKAPDEDEWSASRPGRALPPGKPVPIRLEAGWATEPIWTQRLEEKILSPLVVSNPGRPVCSRTLY
jgi:hypothetical protein